MENGLLGYKHATVSTVSVDGCAQSSSRRPETRHREPVFLLLFIFVATSQQVAEGDVEDIRTTGKKSASKSNVILSYSAINSRLIPHCSGWRLCHGGVTKYFTKRGETSRRNATEAGQRVAQSWKQSLTS